jgi:hypothetical protein
MFSAGLHDLKPPQIVETRIVQRALVDVLQGVQSLQPFFLNPHSFGGIKRQENESLAAVPARRDGGDLETVVQDSAAMGVEMLHRTDFS